MGSQTLQFNRLDIVATHGKYLIPPMRTPVFEKSYDEEFAAELAQRLDALTIRQLVRRAKYHEAADEWPIGHTPPEVKERRRAELRVLEELERALSDEDSDSDEVSLEKGQAAPGRASHTRLQETRWLPTPPLSTHSPIPTSYERKRRHVSTDEVEERPRKTRITSTASVDFLEDTPNMLRGSSRKRRWADDANNERDGDGDRQRYTKARKAAALASSQRRTHQPIRSEAG
ncbi:hypothetical protein HD806DRAFT_420520 [Xylariaceae sp. AK1471]|nr:hypothetical protein HD806DRAFT_420520 [Xylariaceae sp. AK1471]